MATDRSTLPRGPYPNAGQPATPSSGRRPPGAPRERKPALAALALLLVAGGATTSALLVIKTGHKVPAIEISREIGPGQRVPLNAMREVQVPASGGLSYVAWSQRLQVTRYFAGATIPAGTLLTARMVVPADHVTAGRHVLGLTLKPGQVPATLKIGDHVDVYDTNTAGQDSCPGLPGATLTRDAIVTGLATPDKATGNSNVGVDIALDPPDTGQVACAAANGWAAIGILPAGGTKGGRSAAPSAPGDRRRGRIRAGTGNRRTAAPAASTPEAPTTQATPGILTGLPTPAVPASPGTG